MEQSPSSSSGQRGTAGASCLTGSRTISPGLSASRLLVKMKIYPIFSRPDNFLICRSSYAVCHRRAVPGGGEDTDEEGNCQGQCREAAVSHGENCLELTADWSTTKTKKSQLHFCNPTMISSRVAKCKYSEA